MEKGRRYIEVLTVVLPLSTVTRFVLMPTLQFILNHSVMFLVLKLLFKHIFGKDWIFFFIIASSSLRIERTPK